MDLRFAPAISALLVLGCGAPSATLDVPRSRVAESPRIAPSVSCAVVANLSGPARVSAASTDPSVELEAVCAEACARLRRTLPGVDCGDETRVGRAVQHEIGFRDGAAVQTTTCSLYERAQLVERASAARLDDACIAAYRAICAVPGRRCERGEVEAGVARVGLVRIDQVDVARVREQVESTSSVETEETSCTLEIELATDVATAEGIGADIAAASRDAMLRACVELQLDPAACADPERVRHGRAETSRAEGDAVVATVTSRRVEHRTASGDGEGACARALERACADGACSREAGLRLIAIHGVRVALF